MSEPFTDYFEAVCFQCEVKIMVDVTEADNTMPLCCSCNDELSDFDYWELHAQWKEAR
jgi:hypothetical protein